MGENTPISELPRFHCYFIWTELTMHVRAGKMNNRLIQMLFNEEYTDKHIKPEDFKNKLRAFLADNGITGRVTLAGKNPAFDSSFLFALGFTAFEYRHIDPAILYLRRDDDKVPGLMTCVQRAGGDPNPSNLHDEQFDTEKVIELMRKFNHA